MLSPVLPGGPGNIPEGYLVCIQLHPYQPKGLDVRMPPEPMWYGMNFTKERCVYSTGSPHKIVSNYVFLNPAFSIVQLCLGAKNNGSWKQNYLTYL